MAFKGTSEQQKRREKGMNMLRAGVAVKEVSAKLDVDRSSVYSWKNALNNTAVEVKTYDASEKKTRKVKLKNNSVTTFTAQQVAELIRVLR